MARATAPITVADADKFREEVSLHTLPGALRSLSGWRFPCPLPPAH